MPSISNIRIGTKLAIMSGIAMLLVAGLVLSGLQSDAAIREASDSAMYSAKVTHDVQTLKVIERGLQNDSRDIRFADSAADMQKALDMLGTRKKAFDDQLDSLVTRFRSDENRDSGRKLKALMAQYDAAVRDFVPLKTEMFSLAAKQSADTAADTAARSGALKDQFATIVRERIVPLIPQMEELLTSIDSKASGIEQAAAEQAVEALAWAEHFSIALGGAVVVILIGSVVFGMATIARPLRALIPPLEKVAAGDFTVTMPSTGRKDEVGLIASAASAVVERVGATIGNIKTAANEVTSASAEISTSTTDLSQRTEEQAASLEETSAAMEEMAATVKKNAENAQQANQSARGTRDVADRGGQVVAKAVEAMARIEESSRKISDIIGVIDEIARQTNLLALNAAVEAARAGEAGRGFAVVASEVRSLAQRSSQAAKDIKDLITNSNSQVKDGVGLVNEAGTALNEIVESIRKVADIVSDIAAASAEQSTGLEQISKALAQMDEVTQQNSALVEENAATAKTLESQAQSMDQQVAFFQVEGGASARGEFTALPMKAAVTVEAEDDAEQAAPRMVKPAPARAKPAEPAKAERVPAGKRNGSAGRPRVVGATALKEEQDWKEF
jgi:methyl-accepting chemotaxis protein